MYSVTIPDGAKVRALQSWLNDTKIVSPFATFSCTAGSSPFHYDFQFSFHGLPVQEVQGYPSSCGFLSFTTLGLPSPLRHFWPDHATWLQIMHLTGMPELSA
ncbi:MAG: hypothetical protein IVW57_17650 [Ktedonobacterales bacterium]|nr:hypothetical protein [Ktedonobacterales bacterium]